ncbi:MAG: hypothetical protein C0471_10325 [Erythrobacter sp.]|nr:hypothetical protein [Erythrobacter sp.]
MLTGRLPLREGARDAVFVIGVDADQLAARIRDRDDAPALISMEKALVGGACTFILHDRIVGTGPVDVTALERIGRVILRDHVHPVIGKARDRSARDGGVGLIQPPKRIIGKVHLTDVAAIRFSDV